MLKGQNSSKSNVFSNYPHLKDLFGLLKSKIKALSPNIKEEYRVYYVSYRMDKCFVYLWPTKKAIWVYFRTGKNFKDQRKICEKVPKGINPNFTMRAKVTPHNLEEIFELIVQSFYSLKT